MNTDAYKKYMEERISIVLRNSEIMYKKLKECESYTEKVLKKKYADCGVVYNGYIEALKSGYFRIWIDNGVVTHKNIKLEECGIKPLKLEPYPVLPK